MSTRQPRTITEQDVSEQDPLQYYASASDLMLAPGEWPDRIATSLGNGTCFRMQRREIQEGELLACTYTQDGTNALLTIFND